MFTIANLRPFGTNVGNHAINFALRRLVYQAFGRLVSLVEIPASPSEGFSPATVHSINSFADGVIVGGGNIYENNALMINEQALKALEPPLMLFSNSMGRVYGRFDDLTQRSDAMPDSKIRALLARADLSVSRDSSTHEWISKLGGEDRIGWCPTINLGNYRKHLPPLPENEITGVLISVRNPSLMNVSLRHQVRVRGIIASAVETLRSSGFRRIRILCNDTRDLEFANSFRSLQIDSVFAADVYEYLSLLEKADFLLSFRLHATLPAISFDTPVVNVTYDERAESLLRDLSVQDSSVHLVRDTGDAELLIQNRIRSGGFVISEEVRRTWDTIALSQLGFMREFRELVLGYINQDSSLAR